jgi:hypothetical protein
MDGFTAFLKGAPPGKAPDCDPLHPFMKNAVKKEAR